MSVTNSKQETSAEVASTQPEVELEAARLPEDEFPQPLDEEEVEASAETVTETSAAAPAPVVSSSSVEASPWHAIYSPQHGAYYFHNTVSGETTWVNPLAPVGAESSSSSDLNQPEEDEQDERCEKSKDRDNNPEAGPSTSKSHDAMYEAAIAAGIDPALAHLDPSLLPGSSGASAYKARFNARTGAFTAMDARTPDHLSEFERAKRMSEVFFDTAAYEQQIAERAKAQAEGKGEKRKRPTKSDLDRFKAQKKAKKLAKTAWLRE